MKGRFLKFFILVVLAISIIALLSCSGHKAEELFSTAQFEELQNNREHARQLYTELIEKYPESEYAKKAEQRLADLQK